MPPPRLLIVDDDPYTRGALGALLRAEGWQVDLAATLAQGLAALDAAPRVAILDLDLPDGPGEWVLREVRSRRLPTRVAICSGLADPVRLSTVRALGPEIMLWKPIDLAPVFRLCANARSA